MSATTTLSVIVPVYNEQYLVAASLARLKGLGDCQLLSRIRIIVVDDASYDATPAVLERFRQSLQAQPWPERFEWVFLRHERNQGKGAGVCTGLNHADTELVVIHDADLEYFPEDLKRMIPLFLDLEADAVFGSRFLSGDFRRVLFFRHALANHLLTFLCDLVCDLNLTDMETCYKMARTELLRSIPLESRDFRIEPELAIKLAKRGARIFEVPIRYAGRGYQEGKKIGWRDGVKALGAIVRFAVSDRIFTEDVQGGEILKRLVRAPRFSRWMTDTIQPWIGQRVLEIGAGTGNLTVNLVPREFYCATDVNPQHVAALDKLCESRPYLRVQRADAAELETFPPERDFDTIVCLNVVEHIADDALVLRNITAALAPGGRAVILVPQGRWLFGTLDEALGHRRRYAPDELLSLGRAAGLECERIVNFNRSGVAAWWLNGKLLQRRSFGLAQVKLLNLLTPLFRRIDGWLPMPALSLIAVFRKPAVVAVSPVEVEAGAAQASQKN